MTENLTSSIRGAWNADTTYQLGVVVWHSGQAWASTVYNNLNSEPTGLNTAWLQLSTGGGGGLPTGLTYVSPCLTVGTDADNQAEVCGSATGDPVSVSALGTDANIPIKLAPKMSDGSVGQGFLQVGPETAGPAGWAGFALGTEFRMTAATPVAAGSILTGHDVTIQGAAGMFPAGISTNISGEEPVSLYLVTSGSSAGLLAGIQNRVHATGGSGQPTAYYGETIAEPGATPTAMAGAVFAVTIGTPAVVIPAVYGVRTEVNATTGGATAISLVSAEAIGGGSAIGNLYGFHLPPILALGVTNLFGFYSADMAAKGSTMSYAWFDSAGVRVVREASAQAIDALHNPAFTKYTPGLANYERVVTGQWNANVAEIGTEAGGTGTLRPLRLIGASVELPTFSEVTEIADPAAPAANKARLYARDNGAGKTQIVVRFPTGAVQVIATEP